MYKAILLALLNLLPLNAQYKTFITVSKAGDGDFTSIQEAVNSCKSFPDKRITIHIKRGIYKEKVEIHSWNTNITFRGDDKDSTIITWNDSAGSRNNGTFNTYTLKVCGNDFIAENLTVKNSAGEVGQAVALHVEADRVIIKNCNILGNQDTLYAAGENSRQYYKNCYIEGTTDYIFGGATAIFENCTLHSKKNSFITAASTPAGIRFGFVFTGCNLTFSQGVNEVFLGRPWRSFAKTVFVKCRMGEEISPLGWDNWNKPEAESTVYYGEYKCFGPGADRKNRVKWSIGISDEEIKSFNIGNIFSGITDQSLNEKDWFKE